MPLRVGKVPIVVPRQKQYDEHVNDHQLEFAHNVADRMGTIIPVDDVEELGRVISEYDEIVEEMGHGMKNHSLAFCEKLEEIVDKLMGE